MSKQEDTKEILDGREEYEDGLFTEDTQQEPEEFGPKDPVKNPGETEGDKSSEENQTVTMTRSDLQDMLREAMQVSDSRWEQRLQSLDQQWERRFQRLESLVYGDGQEQEQAVPPPPVEPNAESVAKISASMENTKQKAEEKAKPRKSVLVTEVSKFALGGNDSDPGDSGDGNSSEEDADSQAGRDDLPPLRHVTTRARKKQSPQTTYLQTLSQKAPQLPLIQDLDDQGFRDLDDRDKQYVEECRRIKMEPRTIDYCTSNTKDKKLRNEFRYAWLEQNTGDPVFLVDPDEILDSIRQSQSERRGQTPERVTPGLSYFLREGKSEGDSGYVSLVHRPILIDGRC